MKLEHQVCSLELAKQLKELGVKQESLFTWVKWLDFGDAGKFLPSGNVLAYKDDPLLKNGSHTGGEFYSAFTVAELINLLPPRILGRNGILLRDSEENCKEYEDDDHLEILWLGIGAVSGDGKLEGWTCEYGTDGVSYKRFESKDPADAAAQMLVYLLENNLVKL